MEIVLVILLIGLFVLQILIIRKYYVKLKKMAELRRKIICVSKLLIEIQLELLRKRGFNDVTSFEVEIAKYLKDYLLGCLAEGRVPSGAIVTVHPYIVRKYPVAFEEIWDLASCEAESIWKMNEVHMEHVIKRFDKHNRNLQQEYDAWRRARENEHCLGVFVDCAFVEARESFSEYCHLAETVPFEVMLRCEQQYEARQ